MRKTWVSRWAVVLGGLALSASGWAAAAAQEATEPARRAQAPQTDRPNEATAGQANQRRDAQSSQITDSYLATCLLIDNQVESALGQFAQQRAESDEVRQFAEKMAQEHQQTAERLKRFVTANQDPREGGARERQPGAEGAAGREAETERPARTPQDQPGEQPRPGAQPATQAQAGGQGRSEQNFPHQSFFVTLKKDIGEQMLQSAQKELGAKKGDEFDKCYMTSQALAHQHMVDTLKVFQKYAGEELKPMIEQSLQTAQNHLEESKQIVKNLENKSQEQARKN